MAEFVPTDDEVLAAIDSAGWLLEQQAARVLDAQGFATRPSWAFRDPDNPTNSRELDVWSVTHIFDEPLGKIEISVNVLVECKQSDMPYCAIGQELPEYRRMGNPAEHTLPVSYVPSKYDDETNTLDYQYAWDAFDFRSISARHGLSEFRATQLTRLESKDGKKWRASNEGIFSTATYPLAKAIRAFQESHNPGNYVHSPPTKPLVEVAEARGSVKLFLRFPVILISCPLYVVDAGSESPVLTMADWVRLQRHLVSEHVKGLFEFDIVTRDYFPQYLEQNVLGFANAIAEQVSAAPFRYTGEDPDLWPSNLPDGSAHMCNWRFPPKDFE
jgi:hypothetical protein